MLEFITMTLFWAGVWFLVFIALVIWFTIKDSGNGPRGTGSA